MLPMVVGLMSGMVLGVNIRWFQTHKPCEKCGKRTIQRLKICNEPYHWACADHLFIVANKVMVNRLFQRIVEAKDNIP